MVTRRELLERHQRGLLEAFSRQFDLSFRFVEDGWPQTISDIPSDGCDAIIWFVKFRHFLDRQPFRWGEYGGARVFYDMDSCQNFSAVAGTDLLGKWPPVFRANDFHVLVCTGKEVAERYRAEGVHSYWIPKGYDAERIFDKEEIGRRDVGHYGTYRPARRAMCAYLDRRGLRYTPFSSRFEALNDRLNQFLGCIVCNMEVAGARWIPPRLLRRVPTRWLRPVQGPEPMIKNFEVGGAGCAPIVDDMPELHDLGFEDGKTMVSYSSFRELADKLEHYATRGEDLRSIGRNAAELCRSQHTWDHRARALSDLIETGAHRS